MAKVAMLPQADSWQTCSPPHSCTKRSYRISAGILNFNDVRWCQSQSFCCSTQISNFQSWSGKESQSYTITQHKSERQRRSCTVKGGAGSQFLCPQSLLSFPSRASLTLPVVQETAYAFLKRIFLPVGYPHSTADGYMKFSQNTFFQILFSQMSRVMATQAMLLAVGVGTKQTVPLAAVTAWVLKDGIGHIVAIAFGTFINQRFDSDPKRFRFQAATLGKLADSVSILTLHWPQYFLPLSALGGAFSRLSANTGASCRPKIYETFALSSNLGDIMRCSQKTWRNRVESLEQTWKWMKLISRLNLYCMIRQNALGSSWIHFGSSWITGWKPGSSCDFCRCMTAQTTAAQLLGTAMGAAVGPFLGSNLYALMWKAQSVAVGDDDCLKEAPGHRGCFNRKMVQFGWFGRTLILGNLQMIFDNILYYMFNIVQHCLTCLKGMGTRKTSQMVMYIKCWNYNDHNGSIQWVSHVFEHCHFRSLTLSTIFPTEAQGWPRSSSILLSAATVCLVCRSFCVAGWQHGIDILVELLFPISALLQHRHGKWKDREARLVAFCCLWKPTKPCDQVLWSTSISILRFACYRATSVVRLSTLCLGINLAR